VRAYPWPIAPEVQDGGRYGCDAAFFASFAPTGPRSTTGARVWPTEPVPPVHRAALVKSDVVLLFCQLNRGMAQSTPPHLAIRRRPWQQPSLMHPNPEQVEGGSADRAGPCVEGVVEGGVGWSGICGPAPGI
jgi:hypothetical protein